MANDILVKVGADISDFARGMKDSTEKLSSFGKATKTNELTLGKLAAAVGLVAVGTKALSIAKSSVNKAFNRIDTFERFERVMTTITGSATETKKALDRTNDIVKGTAFTLDGAAASVQNFVTRGMTVDKATKYVEAFGDAVAFYGDGSQAQFDNVNDALSKMVTKGTVGMDQLNRLFDAGIDAVGIYAMATGKNAGDVQEALSKGKISAEEFIDTVTTGMMEGTNGVTNISGAAKKAGASWASTFGNMQTAVARGMAEIITSIDNMLKSNGLPDMRTMVAEFGAKFEEVLKKGAESIPPLIQKIKEFKDALVPWLPIITPIAAAFGIFIGYIAGLNTVVKIAEGVWTAFNFVLAANPYVLIVAGLLLIATGLVMAYKKVEWFRDMVDAAWAWLKKVTAPAFEFIKNLVTKSISDMVNFGKELLDKFKKFWDENGAQILALVTLNFKNIWENIKMVMGLIKGIFEMVWPIISGIVQIAWGLIKTYVRNGIDLILGIIKTVMALIRGDWEGAWNTIKETADKIWKNIVKFFEEVDLHQIGKDIIQGLINGIGSMGKAVWTAAENIARNVKEAIMSFLGVHSPARELIKIGKHTGEGFAIGIENMRGKVKKAADLLAAAAIPDKQQVTLSYATPQGSYTSINKAIGNIEVGNATNGGYSPTFNNYFTPAESTPFETSRKIKQMSQRMAMEVRMR
ncbi:tape measure protein [Lederbergia citri]|uniref:Tape measure protein n=1 Tax=Lederbergia citri TaxID=2833580 RepID=A0A942T974_9BACI|nr:tape measure protein [Lederbergia citri]MBS4193493.1 tape measure protein [Lederbergia citri]